MTEADGYFERLFSSPLVRLTLSGGAGEYTRAVFRPITLKGRQLVQIEKYTASQVFHENVAPQDACGRACALFSGFTRADGESAECGLSMRMAKSGRLLASCKKTENIPVSAPHDREKSRLLPEGVPVPALVDLGVMNAQGYVRREMYDKYCQINRFLEFVNDIASGDGRKCWNVVDFGCGKSYLTFVLYYYFTEILKKDAAMTGLDLKEAVVRDCAALAEKYGCENLSFSCCDVRSWKPASRPDMVVTLHACDTATDYALHTAVEWGTDCILSVPCCQHEVNAQLSRAALPPITGYGLIKERFAALATDAIRAKCLEWAGYDTQVLEFIDIEHSPKNLLLRARRRPGTDAAARARAGEEIKSLCSSCGIRPLLPVLLGIVQ